MRILVIDDDPSMTELLRVLLEPVTHDVQTANSGEEGLALARRSDPDLIILDLLMPGVNGWQICEEMRSFTHVPILILSALNSPSVVAQALDAGADDYMTKPVSSVALIARVNGLTRRNQKSNSVQKPLDGRVNASIH